MNKREFIDEVSKRCGLSTYVVEESLNVMSNIVAEKLISGENVDLPKLGRFHIITRKKMVGKNLFGTSEKQLESCTYPSFKIYAPLKNRVKNACKYPKNT